jgi:hypothetical protein
VTPAGGAEPEQPAPTVTLAAATTGISAAAGNTAPAVPSTTDSTARWLGGAGLVVGALGLGIGAGATVRARNAVAAAKSRGTV